MKMYANVSQKCALYKHGSQKCLKNVLCDTMLPHPPLSYSRDTKDIRKMSFGCFTLITEVPMFKIKRVCD